MRFLDDINRGKTNEFWTNPFGLVLFHPFRVTSKLVLFALCIKFMSELNALLNAQRKMFEFSTYFR